MNIYKILDDSNRECANYQPLFITAICFSVSQSSLTLCNPMDCNTLGSPARELSK